MIWIIGYFAIGLICMGITHEISGDADDGCGVLFFWPIVVFIYIGIIIGKMFK